MREYFPEASNYSDITHHSNVAKNATDRVFRLKGGGNFHRRGGRSILRGGRYAGKVGGSPCKRSRDQEEEASEMVPEQSYVPLLPHDR